MSGSQQSYQLKQESPVPVPAFPFERKIRGQKPSAAQELEFRIDTVLAAKAADAARQSDATEPEFLLACWACLVWRLTGESGIPVVVLGVNRSHEKGVGPLGIVLHFGGEESFKEIVRQVRDRIGEAVPNGVPPEAAGEENSGAIGFEYVRPVPGASSEPYPFKIKLACEWGDRSASARIRFDPAAIASADARQIGGYFLRLLGDAAGKPGAGVSDLELLPDSARREIVEGFNRTRADFRLDVCFHEMFEQQVERTPDRVALVFDPLRFTYRELNAKVNQLAHYLRARGVQSNVRVGLFVQRSADMIIGLLGILKAGGAYVALHPDLPKARLAHQLTETEASIMVTQERMLERMPAFEGQIVCLDRDADQIKLEPSANLGKTAGPADGIYVIYTSGSTGVPKGVALRHENVVNYTQSICRQLKADEKSNPGGLHFANVSTLAADLGNTPIYASLASGGCLHIIGDDIAMDGALYAKRCKSQPIDVLKITPSHLVALMDSGGPQKVLPRKHLVVGGEALRWELVRRVKEASGCAILNHYAPTECTIGALTFPTEPDCPEASLARVAPLGHPIDNMVVYVLDRKLKPVPIGVPGNLFIGGAGVSNGYVNRPDLTAERFVTDPLDPASGRRFYNSGDRARFLPGGSVEFLGREDDQVKIRGFRVELGEVEAVLGRHPSVERAVVCAKETATGDRSLVTFLIAPSKPRTEEIREFLRVHLPDYMVPSQFVFVDSYPLNANGKVDRRALASMIQVAEEKAAPAQPALGNPIEQQVAAIWREVLGLKEVGLQDNFFDLGGHSLLATQLIARIRARLHVQVPLRAVFEAPTVSGLSEIVAGYQAESSQESELAEALQEIEKLSDEEVQKLLEENG